MVIKVDYEKMNDTALDIKKESENLDKEVDKLLMILGKVKTNWNGYDSDIYCGKMEAYFRNIKKVVGSLEDFSSFMKYANKSYETRDLRWKDEIMEAGVDFGDEELKHRNK